MEQIYSNISWDSMILRTFAEYLLCIDPYLKQKKKEKIVFALRSLPFIRNFPRAGESTFTWTPIILDA